MIFVTTGTQIPFDRLIQLIDEIAPLLDEPIIAQVNKGTYIPENMEIVTYLAPNDYHKMIDNSRVIVAHAGMGSLIAALTQNKPIIIFPRFMEYRECRNNHQRHSCSKWKELNYAYVAHDKDDLLMLLKQESLMPLRSIDDQASPELTESILNFINESE